VHERPPDPQEEDRKISAIEEYRRRLDEDDDPRRRLYKEQHP
jgi:hypothetical protein